MSTTVGGIALDGFGHEPQIPTTLPVLDGPVAMGMAQSMNSGNRKPTGGFGVAMEPPATPLRCCTLRCRVRRRC
jgi:hypothetical protein